MQRFKKLNEIRNEKTRLLYHLNYWDGPLSGVMLWKGEKVYFNCTVDDWIDLGTVDSEGEREFESIRQFGVYRIDKETMDALEYNHELFRKYVGIHTDYDEKGCRPYGALKPYSEHEKFYKNLDPKKVKLELTEDKIIGHFEI